MRLTGENERGHFQGALPDAQAVMGADPPTDEPGPLPALRKVAASAFDNALSASNAGLARAMVLGEREGITRVDRQCFRDTGQAHLLAVSGLHVGLWLIGLLVLLRLAGLGPRQALCALAAVSLYVPLTGAPPSATRAGCAAGIHFGGRLLGRATAPLVVLSVVALAVVIARPRAAFDVAFQLSFGAVLGILVLTRPLAAVLIRPRPVLPGFVDPIRAPVRRSLAVSLAAWMGTLPFVATAMGQAAPAAPAVAVVTVPLTAVVLLSSMAPTSNGYLAVTSHRLLWLDQGSTGWPTDDIVFACDRTDVVRSTETKGRGIGARSLIIEFADGSSANLHVHRSQKPDRIAAAINDWPA